MSFFGQTQRKTNLQKAGVPSPGDYNPKNLSDSRKYSYAPFGSTERLNRSNFKQKQADPQQKYKMEDDISNIKELNFKLKTQEQTSSMFKSETQRFRNQNVQEKPGPGQYNLAQQSLLKAKSHKAFSRDYHLNVKPSVPSIPIDNLGFKEDQNNEMKKVQAPTSRTPDPGSYEVTLQPQSKGVLAWKAGKMVNRMGDHNPGPGQYNYQIKSNKSLSSCFTSTTDRFGVVKKIKQEKLPGPGAYNVEVSKKMSHNISNQGYFNSKQSRFENNSHNNSIGPGSYFDQKKKSRSLHQIRRVVDKEPQIINRTLKKSSIFEDTNKNPGPGQYKTNFGISYQLHKALLRKQATDVLPKQKRKVFQPKADQQIPGPGTYETPSKTNASKPKGKLWKKFEVVNLKQQTQTTPSPMDYNNLHNTIEAKVKQMNSKLTLTQEKPFNSGTQRFKHYTVRKQQPEQQQVEMEKIESEQTEAELGKYHEKKKVKRLVMTTIKVRVPFGISSSKFQQKSDNYYGPDFYNKQKDWVKPSFNIKSKLQ